MKKLFSSSMIFAPFFIISVLLNLLSCSSDSEFFLQVIAEDFDKVDDERKPVIVSNDTKSFPSAEGVGANATGGRGGQVLHVTTLEDGNYNGTFRWAITQNFSRIIVFDVSGTIKLETPLGDRGVVPNNLTIAGQTAPEGGITIEHVRFGIWRTENVIIRYIRFVDVSYFYDQTKNAVFNAGGANNIILDHCSFRYSWASVGFAFQDDADLINGQGNITLQKSIIGDCLTGGLVGAIAIDDERIQLAGSNSIHNNLFVNVDHRFPNVSGNAKAEIINNVVYNYKWRLNTFFNDSKSNLIGNYYKGGPTSVIKEGARNKIGDYLEGAFNTPKIFTSGNVITDMNTRMSKGEDGWNKLFVLWSNGNTPDESKYRVNTPYKLSEIPIKIKDADEAYKSVLADVGANKFLNADGSVGSYLDSVDKKYIDDVNNTICSSCDVSNNHRNKTDKNSLEYPILPTNVRGANYDTDNDGMPDVWEIYMGFNPNLNDSYLDKDGNGYTNIEEFLNLVDK